MIRLLVVDDSALMRRLISGVFAAQPDFEVAIARDGQEALQKVHEFAPDVVTLDIHMPVMDGLACLDRIMLERPCPVIMVASATTAGADATLEAMELGAVDFITKPDGAITLGIDEFAPLLVEKVRAASKMRRESCAPADRTGETAPQDQRCSKPLSCPVDPRPSHTDRGALRTLSS